MKDGAASDAVTESGLLDTVQSGSRKSSLPDSASKPPVPVFRKRTSAGNCAVTDSGATVQDQSAVSSLPDVVDSTKPAQSGGRSPVKSNGVGADSTTVSDDVSEVSQNVSSTCRQQATPTPSLMSAVLATSAASIAMITIQGPSPKHSSAVKQKNGNSINPVTCISIRIVLLGISVNVGTE